MDSKLYQLQIRVFESVLGPLREDIDEIGSTRQCRHTIHSMKDE